MNVGAIAQTSDVIFEELMVWLPRLTCEHSACPCCVETDEETIGLICFRDGERACKPLVEEKDS